MRLVLKLATIAWAVFIFWFSFFQVPTVNVPGNSSGTVLHFAAYFILAFLAMHAYKHEKKLWPVMIFAIGYGIVLEVLQGFVGRSVSGFDVLANTVGVVTAAVIIQNVEKFSKKLKKSSKK